MPSTATTAQGRPRKPRRYRLRAALPPIALLAAASLLTVAPGTARAATVDGTCAASITLNFTPAVTQPLPPSSGPLTTSTGAGTITTCVFPGGGATTGTFTYALTGNLTCTSAENITGTLTINWADGTASTATVTGLSMLGSAGGAAALTATITAGRFAGDQITVANIRDPLALLSCLTTGLSTATGITSLTFTQPF
jgi:hypothetical protein